MAKICETLTVVKLLHDFAVSLFLAMTVEGILMGRGLVKHKPFLGFTRINGPFGAYMRGRFAAGFVACFVLCPGALNLASPSFPYLPLASPSFP